MKPAEAGPCSIPAFQIVPEYPYHIGMTQACVQLTVVSVY